jgi:ABC-type lipoprotein export system ATPase subunit
MTAVVLETQTLCKYYRIGAPTEVRALDAISMSIERGSFLLLTGPSGSGKTTLLALLAALDRPTRGHVLFDGKSLERCSDMELARVRRRMGFVFQDFALIPSLSAEENITYALMPHRLARAERHQRARELLAQLGMEARRTAPARELSGGEQQRVALARALAGRPEVVLADEPTSSLDLDTGGRLLALLQELRSTGTTVVVSSHDPRVLSLATHVCHLEGGRLTSARATTS